MTTREQPWVDDDEARGRIVVLSRNPIAEAIETIAAAVGRPVVVVERDEDGLGLEEIVGLALAVGDAVVLCDHDAPDAPQVLRDALASEASYVAMMASRRRSEGLLAELERGRRSGAGEAARARRAEHRAARRPARSPCRSWPRSWPSPTAAPADRWRADSPGSPARRRQKRRTALVRRPVRRARGSARPPRRAAGAPAQVGEREGRVAAGVRRALFGQATAGPAPRLECHPVGSAGREAAPGRRAGRRSPRARARPARARRRAARSVASRSPRTTARSMCSPEIAASSANRPSPARGERRVVEAGPQQALVPAGAVDLVERERDAVRVDPAGAPGQPEPDDGPQPAHLGVVGEGRDEGVGDRQRLPPGVGERVGRVEHGAVRDGEHAGDAVEHDRQPALRARRRRGRGTRRVPAASAFFARVSRAAAAVSWMPRCIGDLGDASARRRRGVRAPSGHPARAGLVAGDEEQREPVVEPVGQRRLRCVPAAVVAPLRTGQLRRQPRARRRVGGGRRSRRACRDVHTHQRLDGRPTSSWAAARATASAAYSSASSRLPGHAARARTMRGQAPLELIAGRRAWPMVQRSSQGSPDREDLAPLDACRRSGTRAAIWRAVSSSSTSTA